MILYLAPFPKADITPRHNVRVIIINLYDRFASHRALRVIYYIKRALGKVISQRHVIRFSTRTICTYFLFTRRRIRAIVQATKFGPPVESRTGCRSNTKQRAKQRREVCKYDAWILLRINAIA